MNDGGPAFPGVIPGGLKSAGLSLRDVFALVAMHGQITNSSDTVVQARLEINASAVQAAIAEASYQMAEAMLAARERR